MGAYSYLPTLRGFAKFSLGLSVTLVVVAAGVLYFGQTYIIYPAYVPPGSRENVATPADYEMPYDDLELTASDGVKIKAYLLQQRTHLVGEPSSDTDAQVAIESEHEFARSRPTVLFFHANAGNMGHRLPLARMFYNKIRCNVLLLSYRGYGHSEGTPSEKGIQRDSQAALDYILQHPVLGQTQLFFYGQSLGGAVAIDLASRNPDTVTGLILENTFTSITEMARKVLPASRPFMFLCTENWNSLRSIAKIRPSTHVLLLSGLRDDLVPPQHMKELYKAVELQCVEKQKLKWVDFEYGTHNDTCVQPHYWSRVKEFIDEIVPLH